MAAIFMGYNVLPWASIAQHSQVTVELNCVI